MFKSEKGQRIVRFLFQLLNHYVSAAGLGEVFFASLPVHLWSGKFREPDLIFVRHGRGDYRGYPLGADLVVEVVSEGEETAAATSTRTSISGVTG